MRIDHGQGMRMCGVARRCRSGVLELGTEWEWRGWFNCYDERRVEKS